jgi:MarR family transcriptional repressor of emrRAB
VTRFDATENRISLTHKRFPAYPREPAMLVRLMKAISQHVHDSANVLLREYGLNHTDYNVLMMLYGCEQQGMTVTQLRDAAAEKSANVTRVCNILCERGWIARFADPQDRRRVLVSLTTEGEKLVEQFLPSMASLLNQYGAAFDAQEIAVLETLLKRLLGVAEQIERNL